MKFMGMGGEEYPEENLVEAVKKEKEMLEASSVSGDYSKNNAITERGEKLFKTAKKEATGMNNEYEKKMGKFIEEIENFRKFGINELGMDSAQLKEVFKDTIDSVFEED